MTSNDDASPVAFVTGANQGLGLSLVRALCRQLGDGGVVYLAARDAERGQRAVRQLRDEGLAPVFRQLDVRDGGQVSGPRKRCADGTAGWTSWCRTRPCAGPATPPTPRPSARSSTPATTARTG